MKKVLLFTSLLYYALSGQAQSCANSIESNFNGTDVAAGKWIWFSAHLKLSSHPNTNFMVLLNNSQVTSGAFTLNIPNAKLSFSTTATAASYTFTANTWNITVPLSSANEDEIFLSGLAWQVSAGGMKGGLNPVTWTGKFFSDANVSLSWQWSAAVYNNFSTDYNGTNVVLLHNSADHAGTPVKYAVAGNSIGGARGGGASNYTGSWSSTKSTGTCSVSNSPLPISLKSFSALRNKQNVSVSWETASEQDSYGFAVQRLNNGNWEDVAFVASQAVSGNSSSLLRYSYTDLNSAKTLTQYRIKQIEISNAFRYSDIRAVVGMDQIGKMSLYPNPSNDGNVNLVFDGEGHKTIHVYDFSGRVVKQYPDVNTMNLKINLDKGIYLIKVKDQTSGATQSERLIVK